MFVLRSKYDLQREDYFKLSEEYSKLLKRVSALEDALAESGRDARAMAQRVDWLQAECDIARAGLGIAQSRLADIIAMETPNMAYAGRKAVRIARGELQE